MCNEYWDWEKENIEANYQCSNEQFRLALRLLEQRKEKRNWKG
ncbi:MAG: hypothetical protein ACW99A_02790 [Candidatus Kariarchaeaceae archaeon]|jgi:hypothetical protein